MYANVEYNHSSELERQMIDLKAIVLKLSTTTAIAVIHCCGALFIMIQGFKCDHCTRFTQDAEEMRMHEIKCAWNESTKTCFTCEHSGCDINNYQTCDLNVKWEGRINRDCGKWVKMFDYF